MKAASLLGLRTVVYFVPDLERAKAWYSELLGVAPYFDTPYYVGYNVGGFELGLHPQEGDQRAGAGGPVSYWGVSNLAEFRERLIERGAGAVSKIDDVGEGIRVATLTDPFGNLVGLIENPQFPNTVG